MDLIQFFGSMSYVTCKCPRCFEEFYPGDCRIMARSGAQLKAKPQSPREQAKARSNPEPLTGIYYTSNFARRECPYCLYLLPYNIELVPNIVLAIVGDNVSGKTHYLASFIYQFWNEWLSHGNPYSFRCLTEDVEKIFKNQYIRQLYGDKEEINRTMPSTKKIDPLIYKLESPRTSKAFNLILYDISGEDFEQLTDFAHFIFHTSAFIFVADPVTMDPIFENLPIPLQTQLEKPYGGTRKEHAPYTRFKSILDAVELADEGSTEALQKRPIAVMLSKSDLLKHIDDKSDLAKLALVREFKQQTSQQQTSQHYIPQYKNGLTPDKIKKIDEAVNELLLSSAQGGLVNEAKRFTTVKFFASSATGVVADTNNKFSTVIPYRCLDPVLWILNELGLGF